MKASTLEQISEKIDYGFTASAATKLDGPRFLRITDIQNGQVDWEHVPGCQCSDLEFERFRIEPGDIVFARTGATTGKSFLIECVPEGGAVFASYLIRLRPRKSVDPSYLAHFFKTPQYWHQISTKSTGSTQPGVNASKLATLSVPLPPLEEQKRIAAILDKADAIRRKREQAIKLADEFLRSLFLDMFGDPVRNPKGWPIVRLRSLAPELRYGTSVKCSDLPEAGTLPVLRIPNVIGGKVIHSGLKYARLSGQEVSTLMLKRGDILFVRTNGNPEFIGRCAVFECDGPTLFASYLIRARISSTDAAPDFVSRMFMMPSYRTLMLGQAQTTAGNYNVSASSLSDLPVILPPMILQQRFAAIGVTVELITEKFRSLSKDAENLSCSLMGRAFRGQL